jgi:hypothetical protein
MAYFKDARAKIERANHHIARLENRIDLLHKSVVSTVEINPDGGNEVIKYDILEREGITKIALIMGDAVHNLKCALDYAWIETITKLAPHALKKFGKFPAYPTKDDLESALRGHGIDESIAMNLLGILLSEIKPYARGDHAIWPIHRLDIRDKHRLLIPLILYSSVSGIETEENGIISPGGFTHGTRQEPPWYIPMRFGTHVKNKGEISFTISFEYGDAFDESVFANTLKLYSQPILGIVETLETLV